MTAEPIQFEREEIASLLLKRVEGFQAGYRQNVALLGTRGIGKSTLLRRLVRERLGQDPSLVPVCLEVGESENLVEWCTQLIRSLFYALLQSRSGAELPVGWGELLQACSAWSPRAVASARKILELAEAGKAEAAYPQCWDLPQGIAQELGCKVLLVLDEFQGLRNLPVKEPFQVLGRKVMVQNQTMFLLASSEPAVARGILREGLALLFGQFEAVEMGPVAMPTCLKTIQAAWPPGETDPCSIRFLAELSQGHPDHLHHLVHGLREWQPAGKETVLADERVSAVLGSLLWHPGAALRRRFDARLRSLPNQWSRLACVQMLAAVAGGAHRLPEMSEATGRSLSLVRKLLSVLEGFGWVEKEGSLYFVPERLFRFWLVTAYPALEGVGLADSQQGRAQFIQKVSEELRRFRRAFEEPLEERVTALVGRWRDEQIPLDGRRTLLPHLDRLERHSGGAAGTVLFGGARGKRRRGWLFLLREVPLAEVEARRMIQEISHRENWRSCRKVLISLEPPEVNARLILQQARVKVLDLTVLNRLLELYDLPGLGTPDPAPGHWLPAHPMHSPDAAPDAASESAEVVG